MPEVTLKGKAGVAKIKRDGKAIVITKHIKAAVLEERLPYRRLVGKQQQLPVTPAQFDEAIVKAVKAAKSQTSFLLNKQLNETVDRTVAKKKKEIKAVMEKAAMASARAATATTKAKDDTAKALALSTIQEKDLAQVTKERDTLKARKDKRDTHKAEKKRKGAAAAAAAGRTERSRTRTVRSQSSDSGDVDEPRTVSRIPTTPAAAAPKTPAKRVRSMSRAPNR